MATTQDRIKGTSSGTPDEVFTYCATWGREVDRFLSDWVKELYRLCTTYGLRFDVMVGQSELECFNTATDKPWDSKVYRQRGNLAGIGITGDPQEDARSQVWTSGKAAARGFFVHLWGYAVGGLDTMPTELAGYLNDQVDDRFPKIAAKGYLGKAATLADLTGRWAVDPTYGTKIAERMARVFADQRPAPLPTPTIYDIRSDADAALFKLSTTHPGLQNPVLSARNFLLRRCFPGRLGAWPTDVIVHVQDGTTTGSLAHWVNAAEASSTVMIQRTGSILRVIDERDGPWTNGKVERPTARSAKLRARGGNVNNWCLTIELEGTPFGDFPDAQIDAAVWQIQDWYSRYDTLEGFDNLLKHADLDMVDRPNCPGPVYDEIVARLEARGLATNPTPAPTPAPTKARIPNGSSYDLMRALFGAVTSKGRTYRFNVDGRVSQAWLQRGVGSIPAGAAFTAGVWPRLEQVIDRGNGDRLFVFSDGWVHVA